MEKIAIIDLGSNSASRTRQHSRRRIFCRFRRIEGIRTPRAGYGLGRLFEAATHRANDKNAENVPPSLRRERR